MAGTTHAPVRRCKHSNSQEVRASTPVCVDPRVESVLIRLVEGALCAGSVDPTMEVVGTELLDKYVREKKISRLETLHQKLSGIDPTSSLVEKSAFVLFAHYRESLRYEEAEFILRDLLASVKARDPNAQLIPKLHRSLAKLYVQQRAKCRKEALDRYTLLGYIDEFHRPKLRAASKALVAFANLRLYERLCQQVDWLSSELSSGDAAFYYLGKFHHALRRFSEAEQCFARALSSSAGCKARLRLARVYTQTHRAAEAKRVLRACSAEDLAAAVHTRLGDLYRSLNKLRKAEAEYSAAMHTLRSAGARPEMCAEVALRQASLHCATRDYEELHACILEAAACLDGSADSAQARKLKVSLAVLQRCLPAQEFYRIELSAFHDTKDLSRFCKHLVSFAASLEDGCLLQKALASVAGPDSLERGHLSWALADHFSRRSLFKEAVAWYLTSARVLLQFPAQCSSLATIMQKATYAYGFSQGDISVEATITAAMEYCRNADPAAYASLLTTAGFYCRSESNVQAFEQARCWRAAFALRSWMSADVLSSLCDGLDTVYEGMEEFAQRESLLLEYLSEVPTSGKFWLKLIEFYEAHSWDLKEEQACRKAVQALRGTADNAVALLIVLTKWGQLSLRLRNADAAEACFQEAFSVVAASAPDLEAGVAWTHPEEVSTAFKAVVRFYTDRKRYGDVETALIGVVSKSERCETILCAALRLLGDVYMETQRYEQAERAFREMASVSCYQDEAIRKLLQVHMFLGQGDSPEMTELREILRLRFLSSIEKDASLAETHLRYDRLEDARRSYELALVKINRSVVLESTLLEIYTHIAKFTERGAVWPRLVRDLLTPSEQEAVHRLVWRQGFQLEKRREAASSLMPRPDVTPPSGSSWEALERGWLQHVALQQEASESLAAHSYLKLAKFYEKHYCYTQAESALQVALEGFRGLSPTGLFARLATMKLSRFYLRRKRVAQAEAVLSALLEVLQRVDPCHPRTAEVALTLAALLRQRRDNSAAEVLLRQAAEISGRDCCLFYYSSQALDELGSLYAEMQRPVEAERCCLRNLLLIERSERTWNDWKKYGVYHALKDRLRYRKAEEVVIATEKNFFSLPPLLSGLRHLSVMKSRPKRPRSAPKTRPKPRAAKTSTTVRIKALLSDLPECQQSTGSDCSQDTVQHSARADSTDTLGCGVKRAAGGAHGQRTPRDSLNDAARTRLIAKILNDSSKKLKRKCAQQRPKRPRRPLDPPCVKLISKRDAHYLSLPSALSLNDLLHTARQRVKEEPTPCGCGRWGKYKDPKTRRSFCGVQCFRILRERV